MKRQKKAYRLQMTLRIGLPVERVGDPGRAPKCYAQVMKSPSDHQGADTDAKAREFLLPSSSWGSHRYRRSSYREEPRVLDYIAYIGSIHGKKDF